jgi:hypothetical protein
MNGITFRYLISLAIQNHLSLQLMDIVTTYLYELLDSDIYMKVPDGISVSNMNATRNMYCVKLVKSLKQSGRMWYNRLKEFLLNKGYSNNDDCPCVFIRKSSTGFCIMSIYIDNLNIIGHAKDIDEAHNHLKKEFKMKDLGKTKFCLCLQIKHLQMCILVHQSTYVKKVLKKFNMDKAYPQRTPMIVHALEKDKYPFRPKQEGEQVLGVEYPYFSAIGALIYLTNNTRPDITFVINCFVRHSAASTIRHWNDIKNILRYLNATIDLGLFFQRNQESDLIGYADAGYLSDTQNDRLQT